jgi:hypothetical protein
MATNIATLINNVFNTAQKDSLRRLLTQKEKDKLYLHRFTLPDAPAAPALAPTHTTAQTLIGTFHILGSMKEHEGTREEYNIAMFNGTPTFNCSCLDFKLNAHKKGHVCKHICFIVCKLGGIYDPAFFNQLGCNKTLAPVHIETLLQRGRMLLEHTTGQSATLLECMAPTGAKIRIATPAVLPDFTNLDAYNGWDANPDNVVCGICCDNVAKDISTTVACPKCHNVIHRACIRIWIIDSKHTTCVFCRDPVWKLYKPTG